MTAHEVRKYLLEKVYIFLLCVHTVVGGEQELNNEDYRQDEEQKEENPTEYTPQRKPAEQKPSPGKKGFYIALAVCLVAVAVAGWTTYDSVHQYKKASVAIPTVVSEAETVVSEEPAAASTETASSPAGKDESKPQSKATQAATKSQKKAVEAAAVVTKLEMPVKDAAVQQAFSETPLYSKTMKDWRAHTGVDLRADKGTAVIAAADGTVQSISTVDGMGCTVQMTHTGGLTTWYCGIGNVAVKKGDVLKAGQKLGVVDTVPSEAADASHLHFAVQKDGTFVDPAPFLQQRAK